MKPYFLSLAVACSEKLDLLQPYIYYTNITLGKQVRTGNIEKNNEMYKTIGGWRRKKENSTQTELLVGDQYENMKQKKLLTTKST